MYFCPSTKSSLPLNRKISTIYRLSVNFASASPNPSPIKPASCSRVYICSSVKLSASIACTSSVRSFSSAVILVSVRFCRSIRASRSRPPSRYKSSSRSNCSRSFLSRPSITASLSRNGRVTSACFAWYASAFARIVSGSFNKSCSHCHTTLSTVSARKWGISQSWQYFFPNASHR